jgi:hypothetical protein
MNNYFNNILIDITSDGIDTQVIDFNGDAADDILLDYLNKRINIDDEPATQLYEFIEDSDLQDDPVYIEFILDYERYHFC